MMKNIQKGFTLIELMIVVAIIGILAAVAIPAYGDYTARAQAAEAFTLMDGMKTPLTELYTTNGEFAVDPTGVSGITAITTGKYVLGMLVGKPAAGTSVSSVQANFKNSNISNRLLAGGTAGGTPLSVHMYYNTTSGSWTCNNGNASNDVVSTTAGTEVANLGVSTTTIPANVLPKSCG